MKIGDRVINTKATAGIPEDMTGTVAEDSNCPWVAWDNGNIMCRNNKYIKLIKENKEGLEK